MHEVGDSPELMHEVGDSPELMNIQVQSGVIGIF